jgi:RHS repeat-associated protein
VPVAWPGWNTRAWSEEAAKPNTTGDEQYWFGSLAIGMRDASGQMYMRNRYYNPQTGQFTQPDPIGLAGGLNSYGFAAGDPVSYSDPYGLCPICIAYGVFELASAAYDVYSTVQAYREGGVGEGAAALHASIIGAIVPGPGNAYRQGANAAQGAVGRWVQANESMSTRAAAYQARVTGSAAGQVYLLNGVKFDGFVGGTLIDAKGAGYANFVRNGEFVDWFRGGDALVEQAQRQVQAAGGTPIQWHFAESAAAGAAQKLLKEAGVSGIAIYITPP